MQHARQIEAVSKASRFTIHLARHADEVEEAQRLRWRVFADEQGAQLSMQREGLDCDALDAVCDHLIVRERITQAVVGTYRLLPGAAARSHGFYAAKEFDLGALALDTDRTVEIGRACVDRDFRDGAVIALLWSGIVAFLDKGRFATLIGCASIAANDGGHRAATIYRGLAPEFFSPHDRRVKPYQELPLDALAGAGDATPPALIKGYLRAGAWVCGPPAHDLAFRTADLLMLLDVARISPRHARHFMRASTQLEAA